MRHGPDRLNATALTLLALALTGIGAYGLARGYGAFGDARAADPALGDDVRHFVSRNAGWFWPVAAMLSVLIAWVGLRWLLVQMSTPTVSRLPVRAEGPGYTDLLASGATSALARDIEGYAGVLRARARLVGDHSSPEVEITVDVHDDTELSALRQRIEEHGLVRLRTALELEELPSQVHLRLAQPAGRSVR